MEKPIKIPRRYEREVLELNKQINGFKAEIETYEYKIKKNNLQIEQLEHQVESIYNKIRKEDA